MQKTNKLPALLFGLCLGLFVGILAGVQLTKNQPVIYEWKAILKYPYFELTANGKHVPFPDHINLPSKPLDNKKKGGDLPPVAMINYQDGCLCDPCDCTSCACHLTKPVMQKIEGGPKDDKSLLGIGDLAAVLREFKEAIFGTANKPGLRDDIANGLRDYTRSIAVVTTLVLVAHFACFGFVAYNLHRIAERPYQ